MCGLCGELSLNDVPASAAAVAAMTASMARRGPDGAGLWSNGHAALGHRRLKIIDLSERAQQPMVDPSLGVSVAFNGCIYNYKALRGELEAKGYKFFSDGDTEVVLKAWHAWGHDAPKRFNGMFAFAIVERDTGKVTLVRDRLGIKPLYYSEIPGRRVRFASSLSALLAAGDVDTSIDPVALNHYMSFDAVVPPPRTILKGVRKVEPGTIVSFDDKGKRSDHRYWTLNFGRSGDDAGSDFAYTKGAWLLRTLEAKFGRDAFDAYLRGYFDHFAFQSITTQQMLDYLAPNLLDKYPGKMSLAEVKAWIEQPGIPADATVPASPRFAAIAAARAEWLAGTRKPADVGAKDWNTQEWMYFLDGLPEQVAPAALTAFDAAWHLTGHANAEIARRWYLVSIRSGYLPARAAMADYMTRIGRRYLVVPLYEALAQTPDGLKFARSVYAKAKPGDHPITQASIDKVLARAGDSPSPEAADTVNLA